MQGTNFVDLSADFDECGEGPSIPLGLKDGKTVDVTMVERGLACGCVCPACERPLVAAKGEKRQYFRHHHRSDCDSGLETGVHMLAKEILAESLFLFTPAVIAKHGDLHPRILGQRREWPFRSAHIEKTLVGSDGRKIRPYLIVEGDFRGEPFKLLVEIRVRHKQEPRKEAELKERGLAAIEIDLSQEPPIATRDYYKHQILEKAERCWLFNRHIDQAQLEMRQEAEAKYDWIAEKIEAAYRQSPLPNPDRWGKSVVGAGLEDLIDLEIKGGACFVTSSRVWQSAVLHRYVLSTREEIFEPKKALCWLEDEGLLKPAFSPLLRSRDKGQLAHIRDCLPRLFQHPHKVISIYAGELVRRGKLQKRQGERGWRVCPEVRHATLERHDEFIRWRLREGKLIAEYQAIKSQAIRGDEMSWDTWFRTPLSGHQGITPREFLAADEAQFQALLEHLRKLRAMLELGGSVLADLLELPLEPERNARFAEQQKAREAAARRDAEKQAQDIAETCARDEAARNQSGPKRPPTPEPPPIKAARHRTSRKPLAQLRHWFQNGIAKWASLWSR